MKVGTFSIEGNTPSIFTRVTLLSFVSTSTELTLDESLSTDFSFRNYGYIWLVCGLEKLTSLVICASSSYPSIHKTMNKPVRHADYEWVFWRNYYWITLQCAFKNFILKRPKQNHFFVIRINVIWWDFLFCFCFVSVLEGKSWLPTLDIIVQSLFYWLWNRY